MKTLPILLACLTIVAISTSSPGAVTADAPPTGVPGRYSMPGEPTTYFDFRPDGTFTLYQGNGKINGTYSVNGAKVTLTSPGHPRDLVEIANGIMNAWDGGKWPRVGDAAPAPVAKPAPNASPDSVAKAPDNPPAAAGTPPQPKGIMITLTPDGAGNRGRYGASFPPGHMPTNVLNYFWVVERPDHQTKVTQLHNNEWHFSGQPGLYKLHVEYRSGNVNRTVSNVLEVTVPAANQ